MEVDDDEMKEIAKFLPMLQASSMQHLRVLATKILTRACIDSDSTKNEHRTDPARSATDVPSKRTYSVWYTGLRPQLVTDKHAFEE